MTSECSRYSGIGCDSFAYVRIVVSLLSLNGGLDRMCRWVSCQSPPQMGEGLGNRFCEGLGGERDSPCLGISVLELM